MNIDGAKDDLQGNLEVLGEEKKQYAAQ